MSTIYQAWRSFLEAVHIAKSDKLEGVSGGVCRQSTRNRRKTQLWEMLQGNLKCLLKPRVFGLALHRVRHSKNPGHFGLLDWSGTPPAGVQSGSLSGVPYCTPWDCTPGAGVPKWIAALSFRTPRLTPLFNHADVLAACHCNKTPISLAGLECKNPIQSSSHSKKGTNFEWKVECKMD